MKRIVSIIIVLLLALTLCGCSFETANTQYRTTFTVVNESDFAAIPFTDPNSVRRVMYAFGTVNFTEDVQAFTALCEELDGYVYDSVVQTDARSSAEMILRIPHESADAFLAALETETDTRIRLYYSDDNGDVTTELELAQSSVKSKQAATENLQRIIETTSSAAELMSAENSLESLNREISKLNSEIAAYEVMLRYASFVLIVRAPTLESLSTGEGQLVNINETSGLGGFLLFLRRNLKYVAIIGALLLVVIGAVVMTEIKRRRDAKRRRRKRRIHSESPSDVQQWQHSEASHSSSEQHHHHHEDFSNETGPIYWADGKMLNSVTARGADTAAVNSDCANSGSDSIDKQKPEREPNDESGKEE